MSAQERNIIDNPIDAPDNDRSRAWRIFFEAAGRLQEMLNSRLKSGFSVSLPDYNILLALWEAPEYRLRMGELAEKVVYSPSRLTYLVTKLCENGLVERRAAPNDGRGFEAVLTKKGVDLTLCATQMQQELIRKYLLDGLDEESIEKLVEMLQWLDGKMKLASEGNA